MEKDFDDAVDSVDSLVDSEFGDGHGKPKPKFETSNYYNFKTGSNLIRIMPEMFSAKDKGYWSVYHSRHWGYKNAQGKQIPFVCVKRIDPKSRVVTHECGFCVDQDKHKKVLDAADTQVKNLTLELENASPDKVQALTAKLEFANEQLSDARRSYVSQERKFWVNVLLQDGTFAIVGMPKKVYEQLAGKRDLNTRSPGLIAKLEEDEGIKGLDVNEGVWFDVVRTGDNQFNTEYKVEVVKESVTGPNGRKSFQTKLAPLSMEQKKIALTKCKDLMTLFSHTVLTDDQITAIVNGSPAAVSSIASAPRPVVKEPWDNPAPKKEVKAKDDVDSQFGGNVPQALSEEAILDLIRGNKRV